MSLTLALGLAFGAATAAANAVDSVNKNKAIKKSQKNVSSALESNLFLSGLLGDQEKLTLANSFNNYAKSMEASYVARGAGSRITQAVKTASIAAAYEAIKVINFNKTTRDNSLSTDAASTINSLQSSVTSPFMSAAGGFVSGFGSGASLGSAFSTPSAPTPKKA